MVLSPRRIETWHTFWPRQVKLKIWPQVKVTQWLTLTLTPEVDPAVTYNQMFATMEVEFTKYSRYGISYTPDTELAQDKTNRSFGPWRDFENKVISQEPKVADTWNFRRICQKVVNTAIAKIRSTYSVKHVAYSVRKLPGGDISNVRARVK